MMNILALLQCLSPCLETTTVRQMSRIIPAMLAMTGRVTMLGISRWTEKGGSYRTVQRFFHTVIPWATLFWLFFHQHLYRSEDVYLRLAMNVWSRNQANRPMVWIVSSPHCMVSPCRVSTVRSIWLIETYLANEASVAALVFCFLLYRSYCSGHSLSQEGK